MKVLVTGGAGFIGSQVAEAYFKQGWEVVVVDDLSTGLQENLPKGVKFYLMDIREADLDDVFREERFDLVNHHAAQIDVRFSARNPVMDASINILGSLNLLELCRKYEVKKFIFSSTGGAIYGEQEIYPAPEEHPLKPISPYGVAKLAVEKYLYFYHKEYGLNAIALRYANVYGPKQNPYGEAGVVAIFTHRLLSDEPVFINGRGFQTRDYVYIGDVVKANLLATNLEGFHIFNIGTGVETDVLTLFNHLSSLTSKHQEPQFRPLPPGEQLRSCLDATLAYRIMGWRAETPLYEGLRQTVQFFSQAKVFSR